MKNPSSLEDLRQSIADVFFPRHPNDDTTVPKCDGDDVLLSQWIRTFIEVQLANQKVSSFLDPGVVTLLSSHIVTHNLEGVPKPFFSNGNNLFVHVPSFIQSCDPSLDIDTAVSSLLGEGLQQHAMVALTGSGDIFVPSSTLLSLCQSQHPEPQWSPDDPVAEWFGNPETGKVRLTHAFSVLCNPQDVAGYTAHALDHQKMTPLSPPQDLSVSTENWLPMLQFLSNAIPSFPPAAQSSDFIKKGILPSIFKNGIDSFKNAPNREKFSLAWAVVFDNLIRSNPSIPLSRMVRAEIKESNLTNIGCIAQNVVDGIMISDKRVVDWDPDKNIMSSFVQSIFTLQTPAQLLEALNNHPAFPKSPYADPSLEELCGVYRKAMQSLDDEIHLHPQLLAKALLFVPEQAALLKSNFTTSQWDDINQKIINNFCEVTNRQISNLFNNAVSEKNKTKSLDVINFLSSSLLRLPMVYSKNQAKMLSEISQRLSVFSQDNQQTIWYEDTKSAIGCIEASLTKYMLSECLKEQCVKEQQEVSVNSGKPKKRI